MILKRLRVLLVAVCVVAIGAVGFFYLVLSAEPFDGWRRAWLEEHLSKAFEHRTTISGLTSVAIGRDFRIQLRDVRLAGSSLAVERAQFSIPIANLWSDRVPMHDFRLDGVKWDIGTNAGQVAGKKPDDSTWSPDVLHAFDLAEIDISNFVIRYRGANGLDINMAIDRLATQSGNENNRIALKGTGKINGSALELDGVLDDPNTAIDIDNLRFTLSYRHPGIDSSFKGSLDLSAPAPRISADLSVKSQSVAKMLKTLGLAVQWDSDFGMAAKLQGPLNGPALEAIDVTSEEEKGLVLAVTGRVGNIFKATGTDLAFKGMFGEKYRTKSENAGLLDIEMREFQGEVKGDSKDFALENLQIVTNLLGAELKQIGPMRIGRFVLSDDGKLRLEEVRIQDGPAAAPSLDLQGEVADALDFSGITLQGTFKYTASDFLQPTSGMKIRELGSLQGNIGFTDNYGALSFSRLDAKVVDSDVLALTVALDTGKSPEIADDSLGVDLSVANLGKLSDALGVKVKGTNPFRFKGALALDHRKPELDGSFTIGDTVVIVDLNGEFSSRMQRFTGSIESDRLGLADIRGAINSFVLLQGANLRNSREIFVVKPTDEFVERITANVEVDIKSIAGGGNVASHVKGHVAYADRILKLDPLALSFLGGSLDTSIRLDLHKSPAAQHHKGHIRKMPLGRLLKEAGMRPAVTGSIYAKYDVTTAGRNLAEMARHANGSGTVSLWGSTIEGHVIELTGMNAISWLASGKSKSSKIKCAVAPLHLKNGHVSTNGLIFETGKVQVVGRGSANVRKDTIDMAFQPHAFVHKGVDIVTPFRLVGKLSGPKVELQHGAVAGRAAEEIVTAPLNIVGVLLEGKRDKKTGHKACSKVKAVKSSSSARHRPHGKKKHGLIKRLFGK